MKIGCQATSAMPAARPMNPALLLRPLASMCVAAALVAAPATAGAQTSPSDVWCLGPWSFRPILDVRVRAEYQHAPINVGGAVYGTSAVLLDAPGSQLPTVTSTQSAVKNDYFVASRARLGLSAGQGNVTALVTLQDARAFGSSDDGSTQSSASYPGRPVPPVFGPSEAYLDLHNKTGRRAFFRVGRQAVGWGDGLLLGTNDWSATGRSLDAARVGFQVGDLDVEVLASILAMPGRYTDPGSASVKEGSGVELYGVNAVYHVLPLVQVEVTGLARVARQPLPVTFTPSDTYVGSGRVFGDHRGLRYAVEGAYEGGRVAEVGAVRNLSAFAFAGRASLETSLLWHLTLGVQGAFASGDIGKSTGDFKRFDPILPDEHTAMSPMGVWGWSNIGEGGGSIAAMPLDELSVVASYRYAGLADTKDRWVDGALAPVGAALANRGRDLGHELGISAKFTPWQLVELETGYGIFIEGTAAKAILSAAGRASSDSAAPWAYLSARVRL